MAAQKVRLNNRLSMRKWSSAFTINFFQDPRDDVPVANYGSRGRQARWSKASHTARRLAE